MVITLGIKLLRVPLSSSAAPSSSSVTYWLQTLCATPLHEMTIMLRVLQALGVCRRGCVPACDRHAGAPQWSVVSMVVVTSILAAAYTHFCQLNCADASSKPAASSASVPPACSLLLCVSVCCVWTQPIPPHHDNRRIWARRCASCWEPRCRA